MEGYLYSKELVRDGACFRVGDGAGIYPWKDPWIPWRQGKTISVKEGGSTCGVSKVVDLIEQPNMRWKEALLAEICDDSCIEDIKRIDLPCCQLEDKLCWIGNKAWIFFIWRFS